MRIIVSQYAGFCDGVERAYKIIQKIVQDPKVKKPIFILGSLVHNSDVVKRIEKMGVKKIHVDSKIFKTLDSLGSKIGTLVITAHGMGPKIYEYAKKRGIALVDATCPRVINVQRLVKFFSEKNNQILIIGEKNHKEVRGIYEWTEKKAKFVEKEEDVKNLKLNPKKEIFVVSQTTQNQEFVKKICARIKNNNPNVKIKNTICLATQNRQEEVRKEAKKNDTVLIIGSPQSANSTRLWEIAREINLNSYFIERADKIKKAWFKNSKKIWITAGASTPKWIILSVVKKLKKISNG